MLKFITYIALVSALAPVSRLSDALTPLNPADHAVFVKLSDFSDAVETISANRDGNNGSETN
jgi:hypothetical protein